MVYKVLWTCVFWICLLTNYDAQSKSITSRYFEDDVDNFNTLDKLIGALEKAFQFFHRDAEHINLDGFFGFRIAQGQIETILNHVSSTNLDEASQIYLERVAQLATLAKTIAAKVEPAIAANNPDYYEQFKDTIHTPYIIEFKPRRVKPVKVSHTTYGERMNYNEQNGDLCYSHLFGTDKKSEKCTITDECWDMMTRDQGVGYVTTHQLLYFIAAEHVGCKSSVIAKVGQAEKFDKFEVKQCSKIYAEATSLVNNNHVEISDRDLFVEQGVLCGLIGFTDFLRQDWLDIILSWQDDSGCFKANHPSTGRRLLVERKLEDGCLSHESGLATGLLGVYARYLMENNGHF